MSLKNLQLRDPGSLSIHPALKHIPQPGEEELRFFRTGMKYGSDSLHPLLIDEEGRILDDSSRTSWLCAKARQLKEVTVCICAAADVHLIIIRDLAHRRHLSKSAIAYLAVPHLSPAMEASRMRRLENLRKGQETPDYCSAAIGLTNEDLGEELGIGKDTIRLALQVRKEFENPKKFQWEVKRGARDGAAVEATFKEWYEPKLLRAFVGGEHEDNRPVGLGGIIAGIESKKKDPEAFNPKKADPQLELKLWDDSFKSLNQVAPSWARLNEQDQESVLKHWARTVRKMPDDLREKMIEVLEIK